MSGFGWQDGVALGLALLAAAWLSWRRLRRRRRPTPFCGDCPGCEPVTTERRTLDGAVVIPASELTRRDR